MFLFFSGWNLSFRGRQSTVSMVFSRALTEKVPSSLNEGRRKSTRIISHDDHAFNFIYLIKMKDYIVKTTRSLRAEWVRAIDNFVYMMTSSKCRPGTILENLYPPQNFVPVFLYTAVWSLESQFPWKRTDGASIQGNQKWRRLKCAEEMCIRSRTVAPKLSSERLTCYEAKGNLR